MSSQPLLNIIGHKYGRLTVTKELPRGKHGERRMLCFCECGAQHSVSMTSLRSGGTKSCGCLFTDYTISQNNEDHMARVRKKHPYSDSIAIITAKSIPAGTRFRKLTVVDGAPISTGRGAKFKCICDCGERVEVFGRYLRSGNRGSCGCGRNGNKWGEKTKKGQRFASLVAIRALVHDPLVNKRRRWLYRCDCGNLHKANEKDVKYGNTVSCGCRKKAQQKFMSKQLALITQSLQFRGQ